MRNALKLASRLFLAVAVAGAAACGGGSDGGTGPSTPPPGGDNSGSVSGTYALTQVRTLGNLGGGGAGLPADFVDGSGSHLVFLSGTMVLGDDGRFDLTVQITFRGSPNELTDYGTYSVSGGGTIDFDSEKSSPRLSTGYVMSANKITANSQFGGIPFEIDLER
jgi:hypothetical protein